MIDITVTSDRVVEFCRDHGIKPPKIEIVDDAVIGKDGSAVFGRCVESGLILIYRGSFQILYDGSLSHPAVSMPSVLLSVVARKASNVLLHELYHWKQFTAGEHNVLSAEEIEREARQFSDANESQWEDLVIFAEHEKS
jgi:hypothetical protein